MTKTSIYCYEQNGGRCRNKVSPANNYICGAGHGGPRQGGSVLSELAVVAPVINLAGMSTKKKLNLARDPSTSPEFLDELAGDKNESVRAAVAWNGSAWPETLARLAGDKNESVRAAVAWNGSAWPETLARLAGDEEGYVRDAVANNSSTSPETHISLAQEGHTPFGFARGKPINELIKDIHLVDQYPKFFGRAYLSRLLDSPLQEDRAHPKRQALIGYVYVKFAESKTGDSNPKRYKNKIKELFPDDQEMAEMIGY